MRIGELAPYELRRALAREGLRFRVGAFTIAARSRIAAVAEGIATVYPDYPLVDAADFIDFSVQLVRPVGPRAVLRPQVKFQFDGFEPFKPLPLAQAFALFEWGFNWCVANHAHQHVITHAAVVARDDRAVILPGTPGSGKSTLCAALIHRGWRLLSDELALTSPADLSLSPLPRPVSLKNESIPLIARFAPGAVFSEAAQDTLKGTVAHLRAPFESIAAGATPARPRWLIFPKYRAASPLTLTPLPRGEAFMRLAENTFNYSLLGRIAFETLAEVVARCDCYDLAYSELDDAIRAFDALDHSSP